VRESNSSCAGACTAGFYCPAGSITNKQTQCPSAAFYCPEGSDAPIPVSAGFYTFDHQMLDFTIPIDLGGNAGYTQLSSNPFRGLARMAQTICEPGYYCLADGSIIIFYQSIHTCSYLWLTSTTCSRHQEDVSSWPLRINLRSLNAKLQRVLFSGVLLSRRIAELSADRVRLPRPVLSTWITASPNGFHWLLHRYVTATALGA
jgi:hypothetical protein